jgi:thiol-disulfide isomerase/thioredoxin
LRDLAIGRPAPEVEGDDLDGRRFRLSEYRGKVVVLNFGSHFTCGTCRQMYPHERALVKKLEDRPFALVTIDADDDIEKLRAAWKGEGNRWRCVWDQGWDGPINTAWNIQENPTIYVLDHQGVIRYKATGDPGEELDRAVDGLVSALESSTKPTPSRP